MKIYKLSDLQNCKIEFDDKLEIIENKKFCKIKINKIISWSDRSIYLIQAVALTILTFGLGAILYKNSFQAVWKKPFQSEECFEGLVEYEDFSNSLRNDLKTFSKFISVADEDEIERIFNHIGYNRLSELNIDYLLGEQNDKDALYRLGKRYYDLQKFKIAYKYFKNAAELGDIESMYYCAKLSINPIDSFQYYKKAADLGHVKSMIEVGEIYLQGIATSKSEEIAFQYFKRAAEADATYANYKNSI